MKIIIFILIFTSFLMSNWQEKLYTPTQITKIKKDYFIVDCWHHRILYSNDINKDIKNWNILTDKIAGPHSIVSDGELYLTEDTGRGNIFVFKKENNLFTQTQTIKNIGYRPHRTIYDENTGAFFTINSGSQDIVKMKNIDGLVTIEYNKKLNFLNNRYTRSISIINDKMYFLTTGEIIETEYKDDTFKVINSYKTPKGYEGTNDLFYQDNLFYLTSTPQKIISFKNLEDLANKSYTNIYDNINLKGTPYYMSFFDDKIYIPIITEYSGIVSLTSQDLDNNIETLFDFGPPGGEV